MTDVVRTPFPKTVEEARALPEIDNEFFEYVVTTDERGKTVVSSKPLKLYPVPIDGDDIILFTDTDGRTMKVTATEHGPAKIVFRL